MANEPLLGDNRLLLEPQPNNKYDLIYLDPPYNSGRNYNVVVSKSTAHEEAYKDTWNWLSDEAMATEARSCFNILLAKKDSGTDVEKSLASLLEGFFSMYQRKCFPSSTLAYLSYMSVRFLHLHRVLSQKGSLYCHCDPTASHYLKILLDLVFGAENFRSEIIWKRSYAHNNSKRPGPIHDVILFYTKSSDYTWNRQYHAPDAKTSARIATGHLFENSDLTGPGIRKGESGQVWQGAHEKGISW